MAVIKKFEPVEPVEPVAKSFGANDRIRVKNSGELAYNSYVETIHPGKEGWAHGFETYSNDFLEVV